MPAAIKSDQAIEAARDSIVGAAEECIGRYGLGKTTMEDVAKAAGMSRATVYRHFADRDDLVTEVVVRHARRAMGPTRAFIERHRKLDDKLVEGLLFNTRLGLQDPVMQPLMMLGFSGKFLGPSGVAVQLAHELWQPILSKAQDRGQMRADIDLLDAAAWLVQVNWMLVAEGGGVGDIREEQERLLRTFLVPAFLP